MTIQAYHGNTFVAFIDISGFKAMMEDRKRARDALSSFFQTGYSVLKEQRNVDEYRRVDGLFVSDCGILFSRFNGENQSPNDQMREALGSLLCTVETISTKLLKADLMLTSSIAYGRFDFHERIDFSGIVKNMMFGYAYLNAYLDNEAGKPKLSPGQCRILKKNLDEPFLNTIIDSQDSPFDRLQSVDRDNKHLYFFWMVENPEEIVRFINRYRDTYNLKYRGMLEVLKRFSLTNDRAS